MRPRDRGDPPKRERPALAGAGALENKGNSSAGRNKGSARRGQGWRPSPAVLRTGRAFYSPHRGRR